MKEIDLRSLLYAHLKCTEDNWNFNKIKSMFSDEEIIPRDFNDDYIWKLKKSTYYLESIMLNIECQSIVLFNYKGKYHICDGLNRIITINRFINNELKLSKEGLNYFTNLVGNKFKDLDDNYQEKFINNIFFQIKIYTYEDINDKELSYDEIKEIIKYLYHLYNNCTKLELVDIQRAEYCDEKISNLLKEEMKKNPLFINKLEAIFFMKKGNKNKSDIDLRINKILINIRNYLCITYNGLKDIIKYNSTRSKIKNLYLRGIEGYEPQKVITDFNICIDFINDLTSNQIWKNSENTKNKYFIEMLYWFIANIKKDNLYNISSIPLEEIIKYFNQDKFKELFLSQNSYDKDHFVKRIEAIVGYADKYLGIDMRQYLESYPDLKKENNSPKQECSFYPIQPVSISVKEIISDSKRGVYFFSPAIQRGEVISIDIASEIIQSMILGIKLPPILVYEESINNRIIRTIIDGKQRILSVIGYLGETYLENNEQKKSKKDNFALQNLKIMSELNGKKFNNKNTCKVLEEKYRKIIENYKLDIIIVNKDKLNYFNKKEHFLRLNGSFNKKKAFDTWTALYDTTIINKIKEISKKQENKLFSKNANSFNDIIIRFAFLEYKYEYENNYKLRQKISPKEISTWLEELEKIKSEKSLLDPEMVKIIREKYLTSIKKVDIKLVNIENWILKNDYKLEDIFCLKNKNCRKRDYICLYQLIGDISLEALNSKHMEIVINLKEFYTNLRKTEYTKDKDVVELLGYYKTKIDILDASKRRDTNFLVNKMM